MMKTLMITPRRLTARCGVSDYSAALLSHLRGSGFQTASLSPEEHDLRDLVRRLHWFRPDILHLQYHRGDFSSALWPAVVAVLSGLNSIPLVTTFHDIPQTGGAAWMPPAFRMLVWVSRRALFTNTYDMEHFLGRCPSAAAKAGLVPVGPGRERILPAGYDRRCYRRRLGVASRETLLLYFGFLRRGKGVEYALEAMSTLISRKRSVKLLIIGDLHGDATAEERDYARRVYQRAQNLNGNGQVIVKGYLAPDEVSGVLQAGDIGVLPFDDGLNAKRSSYFTLVSHGLPTISTRGRQSVGPLIRAAAPFLVPGRDAASLAALIERMISGRASFAGAWKTLENYVDDHHSWPAIVAAHEQIYHGLVNGSYPASRSRNMQTAG